MLVSRVRLWWWRRGYKKFYGGGADRSNTYAMNAGTEERFNRLVVELRARLAPSDRDRVLDVGGGNGVLAYEVFKNCERIVVVDYCLESMRPQRARLPGVRFVVAEASRLPFRNGSFSTIFAYSVLPHVGSQRVLRAMLRGWDPVLSGAGIFYLGDVPDREKFLAIVGGGLARLPRVAGFKYCMAILLNSYFSKAGLRKCLAEMGYDVTLIEQTPERRFHAERFDVLGKKRDESGRTRPHREGVAVARQQ